MSNTHLARFANPTPRTLPALQCPDTPTLQHSNAPDIPPPCHPATAHQLTGCVDLAYDNKNNTLAAAFSNECVAVIQGHERLVKGANF